MSVNTMSIDISDLHISIASSPLGLDNGITGFPQVFSHVASDEDFVLDHKNDRSMGTVVS
jgi:hypothetical protein